MIIIIIIFCSNSSLSIAYLQLQELIKKVTPVEVNDNRVAHVESPFKVTKMFKSSIYVRYLAS
jgi:hypothetical protein